MRNEDIIITNNTHIPLMPLLLVLMTISLVVVLVMVIQRHWSHGHHGPGPGHHRHWSNGHHGPGPGHSDVTHWPPQSSEPIIQVIAATHSPSTILTNIRSVNIHTDYYYCIHL